MTTITGLCIITFQQLIEKQCTEKRSYKWDKLKPRGRKTGLRQPNRLIPELTVLPELLGLSIRTPSCQKQICHSNRAGWTGCFRKAAGARAPPSTDTYAYTHTHTFIRLCAKSIYTYRHQTDRHQCSFEKWQQSGVPILWFVKEARVSDCVEHPRQLMPSKGRISRWQHLQQDSLIPGLQLCLVTLENPRRTWNIHIDFR